MATLTSPNHIGGQVPGPGAGAETPSANGHEPAGVADLAALIRAGELATAGQVREVIEADHRTMTFTRRTEEHTVVANLGADGNALDEDGDLIHDMAAAEVWTLTPEKLEVLEDAIELFAGKQTELDIDGQDLPAAFVRRQELAGILGLANPYRFTYDQLAAMAGRFMELSRQIMPEPEPPAAAELELYSPVELAVSGARRGTSEFMIIPRLADIDVRSHRRPRPRAVRLMGRAALAALAAASLLVGGILLAKGIDSTKPGGEIHPPVAAIMADPFVAEPAPSQSGLETEQMRSESDHVMTVAVYNAAARSGAVWFMAEDYAAELGYQLPVDANKAGAIVQQCLDYMNAPAPGTTTPRVPGGMNWDKARQISPGQQLPFPPASTMRQWLAAIS